MSAPASTSLVSIDDIRAAAVRISAVAKRTPLIDVGGLAGEPAFAIKCENMQPAGAFKIRGAYNMVAQLAPAASAGVITYSSGNHGQAMALAAREPDAAPHAIIEDIVAPTGQRKRTRRREILRSQPRQHPPDHHLRVRRQLNLAHAVSDALVDPSETANRPIAAFLDHQRPVGAQRVTERPVD